MYTSTRRSKRRWIFPVLIFALLSAYFYYALSRPITIDGSITTINNPGNTSTSKVDWPANSQAALGILDSSINETNGDQKPAPIASVAKVITALTVLEKYPLKPGQQGPIITLSDADVALYNSSIAQDGSAVRVVAGEQISLYQMLQTIMLPSGNNMADSLAIWAYGSLPAYSKAANNYVAKNRMDSTRVGTDASGLSPTTVSTAQDLVKLGVRAMNNPVLAEIAAQETATGIPIVQTIKNVNILLGGNNIVGIKTGNTEQAGGVFLGASKSVVNKQPVTIITAVVGAQNLFSALKESQTLIKSAQKNVNEVDVAKASEVVGKYTLPWGGAASVVTQNDLNVVSWGKDNARTTLALENITNETKTTQIVGNLQADKAGLSKNITSPVTLQTSITQPSIWWRLSHPLN